MSTASIHRKIAALEQQMSAAAEAMDFELAAQLRDEIAQLRGERPELEAKGEDGSSVTVVGQPPPGAMGLGTNQPVVQPPKGWKKPKKPDPLTAHHHGRDRRK
ncbi:UvrB/UvrC motif-containing protein [Devosia rhodophyticola]|uniref:UvrB/UvrC motif-containing protein n=1 Tax=Devosia rhodophyticola TaxID=3026423 RepID=A0ABY7YU10_9HYPH|nr:UvrB/UvrC motif-containing protein [Devosia rhodophyticola]WDR04866.1 UvrB/UvrC motif-containing protein [Devosia rhodophyticola]